MKLIPRNGIYSEDVFGYAVALSDDRDHIGFHCGNEKGEGSGAAYIFSKMNWVRQEEAKIVPDNGASWDEFG